MGNQPVPARERSRHHARPAAGGLDWLGQPLADHHLRLNGGVLLYFRAYDRQGYRAECPWALVLTWVSIIGMSAVYLLTNLSTTPSLVVETEDSSVAQALSHRIVMQACEDNVRGDREGRTSAPARPAGICCA